jgi:hypothetical protein
MVTVLDPMRLDFILTRYDDSDFHDEQEYDEDIDHPYVGPRAPGTPRRSTHYEEDDRRYRDRRYCMSTITTVMIDDKGLSMNGMSEQREEHEARLTMAMSLGLRKPHLKLMTFNTDLTRRPNTSTLKT